jgi:tetratricopeptide (TPR) repeat protein
MNGNERRDAETQRRKKQRLFFPLCGSALFALTLIAYLPALRAQYIWDDNDYLTQNPNLADISGLAKTWASTQANPQYYPLVFTSFWLEYHIWGLHPLGFHLDNILIHSAAAILLWLLLLRLQIPPPAALLAAAIFAIHPVQVESVAWITERKNVLCGFFYFAAMLVYFNGDGESLRKPDRPTYLFTVALFSCALFSKTVAASWPAAILVLIWWKHGKIRRADLLPLLPFFAIGLFLARLTAQIEHDQVGAGGKAWDLSAAERTIIAGRALWFYAEKALLPINLTFIYPRWDLSNNPSLQLLYPITAISFVAALFLFRRRLTRAPATAALLFAGSLLPALGFVNVYPMRYSFVADHFQYLAIAAMIVPAAVLLHRFAGRLAFIVLIPLLALTFQRCEVFHDSISLWTDTELKNPTSWMVRINLGQALQMQGHLDQAEREYITATELEPDEPDTWWKLGGYQASQGRYAEAELNLRRALAVDPNHQGARDDLEKVERKLAH